MLKKVSIICPFRNEEEVIEDTLKSFADQTYKNKEAILLDNSDPDDNGTELAKEYAKKYSWMKYYYTDPIPGGWATDFYIKAIEYATGEIIYMADANGKLEKDYLKKTISQIKGNIAGAVGRIIIWPGKNWISKYRSIIWKLRYDDIKRINKEINEGRILPRTFSRKAYDDVGGFDKSAGWAVDTFFNRRLLKAGYKIIYVPDAVWWHKWDDKPIKLIKYSYKFGKMNYDLAKTEKKQLMKILYFISPFIFIVAGVINQWFLVYALLHPVPIIIKYIRIFHNAKGIKDRAYALMGPIVSYIQNVPYSIGFIKGAISSKEK